MILNEYSFSKAATGHETINTGVGSGIKCEVASIN
jgi:hypothetical protein